MRVSLFATCLVDLLEPAVGVAAVRVLRAMGIEVTFPLDQTCCGQPAWNAGFTEDAARVARTSLEALEGDGADAVVVPAGSCATMMRVFWPELFELAGDHDAAARALGLGHRTFELAELVAANAERLPPLRLAQPVHVAYHHSCHMLRELRIEQAPIALLDGIEGCTRGSWAEDRRCCGFGGLFSVKLPEVSETMGDHKLAGLEQAGTDLVVGSDSSCLLHLRSRSEHEATPIRTVHLSQVLAEALPPEVPAAPPPAAPGTTP
jgi:L-lactate dehydrogenase complex protein LldE